VIEKAIPFKIDGVYCRLVPLTQGMYAIVDESDYDRLMRHSWYARHDKKYGYYAVRNISMEGSKAGTEQMHVVISGVIQGKQVDHENGCGIDNRRKNLRHANSSQNQANSAKTTPGESKYKGVWIARRKNKPTWVACVRSRGLRYRSPCLPTEEDAARAYDRKALEVFGDFARLNFPYEREQRLVEIESAKKEGVTWTQSQKQYARSSPT
jgi:hypothetical protein